MRKKILWAILFPMLTAFAAKAQCPNDNTLLQTFTPSSCNGTTEPVTNCIQGGQYIEVTVTSGNTYTFSTCGGTTFDTQMYLFNGSSPTSLAYDDDGCGGSSTQSSLTWVATYTGTVRVSIDQLGCFSNTLCAPFSVTCSQAPIPNGNDDPCGAVTLVASPTCTSVSSTNATATGTNSVAGPGCADYSGADVWFKVVVPASGSITIQTQAGVVTDGGMAVYTASSCNGPFTQIDCVDDVTGSAMPAGTYNGLTPGSTVYIRFWEYGGDNNGTFSICVIANPPPPANDNPCGAVALTVGTSCNSVQGTTQNTTNTFSVTAPLCASYSGYDVWYTAVVPASGNITIQTQAGVITDGGMEIYTASSCNGPFTQIDCVDDVTGSAMPAGTYTGLLPGSMVYIRVWEYGGNNNGTFSICAFDNTPPPSSVCFSPVPDECSNACDLGTLPAPPACGTSTNVMQGAALTFIGTNVGSSTSSPIIAVSGCAIPASDVWYRVTATGTSFIISLTPDTGASIVTPNISIYQDAGNGCSSLTPLACLTGNGSILNANVAPITPGSVYYIQISGGTPTDRGNFRFVIKNNYNCGNCLLASGIVANPPPNNGGSYTPGTTVEFCYTVSNYNKTAANWLHGIELGFGNGWDITTLTATTVPPSCDTTAGAFWGFYNSITSSHNPQTFGPGFFYETTLGGPATPDNNPGNNFGDVGVGVNCSPTFCWRITAKDLAGGCAGGTAGNLSVTVNTLGDSESGSWSSNGCQADPLLNASAVMLCCDPPIMSAINTVCGNDGAAIATPAGANGPWQYTWTDSVGNVVATVTSNTPDTLKNLAPGQYYVSVTDNSNCTSLGVSTVAGSFVPTATATNTGPYCIGSTITLNATNGSAYTWSGPNNYTAIVQNPTIPNSDITMSGIYSVTVTFNTGCTATATTNVSVASNLTATITPATITICNGDSTTLKATGANNYTWSNSATTDSIRVAPQTTTTYSVTVDDGSGCSASATATITVNPSPTAAINPPSVSLCGSSGASATLTASGGTGYVWSNNASTATITVTPATTTTYTVTVTDGSVCSATASATVAVGTPPTVGITASNSNICSGQTVTLTGTGAATYAWSNNTTGTTTTVNPLSTTTYSVTGTDANGCTATASSTINATPSFTVTPVVTDVTCSGNSDGAINLTINAGGQAPFVFAWSNGATTQNITGLAADTFDVTVTDNVGCAATASAIVNQALPIMVTETHTDVLCNGNADGTITLTINNGTAPYTYLWNDNDVNQNRTGLAAGTYDVIVTDNNSCTATLTGITIAEPAILALTEMHTDVTCNGAANGTIDITTTGGTANYSYIWNDGTTTTEDRAALAVGTYSVTVYDAHQCSATASADIVEPTALVISETHTDALCNANATGTIDVTLTGGNPPYSYLWEDSTTTGITTEDRSNIPAGYYAVVATDNSSCTATIGATISEPTALAITETHTNVTCNGLSDGTIDITVSGGITPYTYLWNDNVTTEDRTAIASGTYTVNVTDSNACNVSLSITVNENPVLNITETYSNATCLGYSDGSINLVTTGGATPYSYVWDDGTYTQNRTNIPAGTYTVTVTDANTCNESLSIDITEPTGFTIDAVLTDPTCASNPADGSIALTVSGASSPYHYSWSHLNSWTGNIPSSNTVSNLPPDDYTVTVTDNNNCSTDSTFTLIYVYDFEVEANPMPTIDLGESTNLSFIVTGTSGNYTNVWTPSSYLSCTDCASPEAAPVVTTLYHLTITNEVGCTATDTVTVFVVPNYDIFVPNAFTPNGDGFNDEFQLFINDKVVQYMSMQIFNRWGEKVYESSDLNFKWDGAYKGVKVPTGVYTYQLKLTFIDGHKDELRTGSLTIIR